MRFIYVVIAVIALLIGYVIGFQIGSVTSLNWCVDKALKFLEIKGVDIEINESLVKVGIMMYRNNIDRWLG